VRRAHGFAAPLAPRTDRTPELAARRREAGGAGLRGGEEGDEAEGAEDEGELAHFDVS